MEKAISEQKLLPKWVVIVLDDDLLKYLNFNQYGISDALGRLINYIMMEHDFELTMFELTVHFKHEMIGIWQRFDRNFE